MKKLFSAAILLGLFINIGAASAVTMPAQPLVSDETKKAVEEATQPAREETFEGRKALILTACNAALIALRQIETEINQSEVLTDEQKKELLAVVNNVEAQVEKYKKAVEASKNADELLQANKELVQWLKDNKEEIRATFAKVAMIGVEATLQAAEEYLEVAAEVSQALKACGSDTTTMDEYIAKANKELDELEAIVEKVMADDKISQDEYPDVQKAIRLSAQLTTSIGLITTEALVAAEDCPAAQAYVEAIEKL